VAEKKTETYVLPQLAPNLNTSQGTVGSRKLGVASIGWEPNAPDPPYGQG